LACYEHIDLQLTSQKVCPIKRPAHKNKTKQNKKKQQKVQILERYQFLYPVTNQIQKKKLRYLV
jgi:hypothetical protein